MPFKRGDPKPESKPKPERVRAYKPRSWAERFRLMDNPEYEAEREAERATKPKLRRTAKGKLIGTPAPPKESITKDPRKMTGVRATKSTIAAHPEFGEILKDLYGFLFCKPNEAKRAYCRSYKEICEKYDINRQNLSRFVHSPAFKDRFQQAKRQRLRTERKKTDEMLYGYNARAMRAADIALGDEPATRTVVRKIKDRETGEVEEVYEPQLVYETDLEQARRVLEGPYRQSLEFLAYCEDRRILDPMTDIRRTEAVTRAREVQAQSQAHSQAQARGMNVQLGADGQLSISMQDLIGLPKAVPSVKHVDLPSEEFPELSEDEYGLHATEELPAPAEPEPEPADTESESGFEIEPDDSADSGS